MYIDPKDRSRRGIVFLVGAGPGAADLLTLRALDRLREADVIVHDRLVSEEVLSQAHPEAERIFVGKKRAHHCMRQEDINALLIRLARAGKRVVRLKGGDPLVFGRGGEEAEALAAAGLRCEIVPGITAALACAADAGIPLTHRGASRSVTLAAGHTKDGTLDLDFAALARPGATLAIYMGIHTLPLLLDGLVRHGFDAATPAALVEWGGTPACRTLRGALPDLLTQAPVWSTGGPTLVLIGDVVARSTEHARDNEDHCGHGGTWSDTACRATGAPLTRLTTRPRPPRPDETQKDVSMLVRRVP